MWWGYLVVVLFIILFIIFLIKIFIEFPGLAEWRFVFSDDGDADGDEGELERIEILEEHISNVSAAAETTSSHKKKANVKAIKDNAEESIDDKNDEIVSQSTADKHALLSNFMSS